MLSRGASLFVFVSFLSLGAAFDMCSMYSWNAEALYSYCNQEDSAAHRSPACSLLRLCQSDASAAEGQLCTTPRLFITLCMDQPQLPDCKLFRQRFENAADHTSCLEELALKLRSTSAIEGFMIEACAPGRSLAGCDQCNAAGCVTADPLLAYAAACAETPGASGCESWSAFCSRESGPVARKLCSPPRSTAVARGTNGGSGGMVAGVTKTTVSVGASSSSPAPIDPCIADSSQPSCKDYVYPDSAVGPDIDKLCDSMPDMPGCAIARACEEGHGGVAAKYCQPFVLLATLCHDMPGMRGCESYKALCLKPGSVVEQCVRQLAVPGAPTWSQARKAVFSACGDHPMAGCANCTHADCPDPLASLSDICHEMPNMAVCTGFWAFCNAAGQQDVAEWCAEDSNKYLPSMLMYFHQRTEELLLWKEWRPRTQGQYVFSCLAIVLMGVLATGLKTVKGALVLRWNHDRAVSGAQPPRVTNVWLPQHGQLGEILAKSSITGVSLTLDYFNMLIAMTFNVGFFCAVIAGYILGTLLFGHVLENYATILHQERRDLAEAARLRAGTNGELTAGGAAGFKRTSAAASDTDSEERMRIAVEAEGDCNCVHSA